MAEGWVETLFDDRPLDDSVRLAVRDRLQREWRAPAADEDPSDLGRGPGPLRRRLIAGVAASALVAFSIGSLVWLAGGDVAEPPATEVLGPTVGVTATPTTSPTTTPTTTPTTVVATTVPPATSTATPETTVRPTVNPPSALDHLVPATGGEPLDLEPMSLVPYGDGDGQILRPAGPPLAVRVGDRLLLVETRPDRSPTGKVLEIERATGAMVRTLSLPVSAALTDFEVYGSPNGVLYMSWRDAPSEDIIWTSAVEEDGRFVLGTPARTGPLEPKDPTFATPVVRVTGQGLLVGLDLVIPSPLPPGPPAVPTSAAGDHLIEGFPVGVQEVVLGDREDGDVKTWSIDVNSDAVGVRGSRSVETYLHGEGVLVLVRRPLAEDYYVMLPLGGRPAGFRSDGWHLAGSDAAGASFVRTTESGLEIGAL